MILKSNEIKKIEKILNYEFNNKELLEQAFIRESYAKEKRILGEKIYGNEQLEFFGDGVLKYILIKNIEEKFCSLEGGRLYSMNNEGVISNFISHFSDKEMLSENIERLGLHNYLILNKGDQQINVKKSKSVKEDLFEAIVGAIWIDCSKNIVLMEQIILSMLNLNTYVIQDYTDFKSKLLNWAKKKHIEIYMDTIKTDDVFSTNCSLEGYDFLTVGTGRKIKIAENNACKKMIKLLENNKLYKDDLVGEYNLDNAINKLQELSQKNVIGDIFYTQQYNYDENVWTTTCNISNFSYSFISKNKNKNISKKEVAYDILTKISNEMWYERLWLYKKDKVFIVKGDNYENYDIVVGYIIGKKGSFIHCSSIDNSIIIGIEESEFNQKCVYFSLYDAIIEYFTSKYDYLDSYFIRKTELLEYFKEKCETNTITFIDDIDKLEYIKKFVDEFDFYDYKKYLNTKEKEGNFIVY